MASRSKSVPVGSTTWVQSERQQLQQFVDQETEEFGFSVRNELEWLNSHMLDVFSEKNINFADVFKTPGKLRGKTPRTARKRDQAHRAPLTDIFALNVPAATSTRPAIRHPTALAHTDTVEDGEPSSGLPKQLLQQPEKLPLLPADSGYHGTTDDEMDVEAKAILANAQEPYCSSQSTQPLTQQSDKQRASGETSKFTTRKFSAGVPLDEGPVSDESFVSAKDGAASQTGVTGQADVAAAVVAVDTNAEPETQEAPAIAPAGKKEDNEMSVDDEPSHTRSNNSSPEKFVQRKSSFTFSSLPAREPMNASRAIPARSSHIDVRNSTLSRSFILNHGNEQANSVDEIVAVQERLEESKMQSKSSTQSLQERIRMLGKRSMPQSITYPTLPTVPTEHEASQTQKGSPNWVAGSESGTEDEGEDEDDDWIAPSKATGQTLHHHAETLARLERENDEITSSARPPMHQKSISTTNIPSPAHATAANERDPRPLSQPNLAHGLGSTTPLGSPTATRKQQDGPLSASKNRLWSALKSAKSIFASSASASAAAKLEAHNASPVLRNSHARAASGADNDIDMTAIPNASYYTHLQHTGERPKSSHSLRSLLSRSPSRKTRSSSESEKRKAKERKEAESTENVFEKEGEKEKHKTAATSEKRNGDVLRQKAEQQVKQSTLVEFERPISAVSEQMGTDDEIIPPPPPPKNLLLGGKPHAPGRLMKPAREMPKAKLAPVNIRVASQAAQRLQQPSQSFSKSALDDAQTSKPAGGGLAHSGSFRAASAQGNRASTAPSNGRVKALEAAARKKEQEEKEKARKAEQKRAIDAKRQAKLEEEKRIEEERKGAEVRKAQEARLAAQKEKDRLAAEREKREEDKRRRDELAKAEQRRRMEVERKAKEAHELAAAIEKERVQQAAPVLPARNEIAAGTLRQLASKSMASDRPSAALGRPPVSVNPAKPAKRHLGADESETAGHQVVSTAVPPQRHGIGRGPPTYQQLDAKRRRTNEGDEESESVDTVHGQTVRSSVMAPPKRPSTMRKDTISKFPHGYTHAAAPTVQHANNMFKAIVTSQHQLQHGKSNVASHPSLFASGKIPFAENANPPAASSQLMNAMQTGHGDGVQKHGGPFKTPARPAQPSKSAKSSPMYANGDNIALPDIATDSEDEEDEDDEPNGFRAPSWVASPALRDLLSQQQLIDPESVFGPIGELKMDEVFKHSKNQDRLKRLRERGSSAMWVESGDAVTTAEKLRDMELRERVVREGGWRYAPGE